MVNQPLLKTGIDRRYRFLLVKEGLQKLTQTQLMTLSELTRCCNSHVLQESLDRNEIIRRQPFNLILTNKLLKEFDIFLPCLDSLFRLYCKTGLVEFLPLGTNSAFDVSLL